MIYCEKENYKLYQGSMLDILPTFEENSVDAIVTDPPYEINFMNNKWDNSGVAFKKETWEQCLRVLKPGGYLLSFGGSRTFHRIACAIEDAGFEIRDVLMWLYGCLSEDTEILTSNGWKTFNTIKQNDNIYSLDLKSNKIIKNKCLNVFKYEYNGEMVNLKNQNTDQLLTPNHHCIVKDTIRTRIKGNTNYNSYDYWYYKDAWQIRSQTIELPLSSNYNGTLEIGNLFSELLGLIISEGTYLKDTNAITISQSSSNSEIVKRIKYILGKLKIKYHLYTKDRAYNNMTYTEYSFYLGKECESIVNKIKNLCPDKKLNYGLLELSLSNKEFLLKGLCEGDGGKSNNNFGYSAFYQKDLTELQVFQTLLHLTNKQGWINENKYCCSIHSNNKTQLQGKHNKERFVKYNGKYVWCIETEIGNFLAKRNGKIFITGNSGFPKGQNVGLAIDKKTNDKDIANKWQGYNTNLKPSYEPIIMARKPFKGSLVDNILEYGVGGINIDECRVKFENTPNPATNPLYRKNNNYKLPEKGQKSNGAINWTSSKNETNNLGRYPANILHDGSQEIMDIFPNTNSSGGNPTMPNIKESEGGKLSFGQNFKSLGRLKTDYIAPCDSGNASRYFYCAKASKKDRDEGLDAFEAKQVTDGCIRSNQETAHKYNANSCSPKKNIHPTVKPMELMQYLIRLVAPKGAKVLDCFNGSGSTGKACMFENRERNANYFYIGIELTEKYLPISEARIEFALNKYKYDETFELQDGSNKKIKQVSIFEL